jgi:hypothetical protein
MRKIGQILLEADAEPHPDSNGHVVRRSADGHNPERLRGLPAIGRNVSGAINRTNPERELLRRERTGELRL